MSKRISKPILFLLCILYACEKNDPTDEGPGMYKITSTVSADNEYTIDLYAETDTLFVGYNKIFLAVTQSEKITEATINIHPLMNMVSKTHAAPFEDPVNLANSDGFFESAVIFIMPSNPDEGWILNVDINHDVTVTTAKLVIPWVKDFEESRLVKFPSEIDGTMYFLSCVEPANPEVGINDCEFTVHYKESMMSFPPATDLALEIEPEMPSMEHGSPNNVHPVHEESGHYKGKVNFTMTGWWRIHFMIKKDQSVVADDKYMDITF